MVRESRLIYAVKNGYDYENNKYYIITVIITDKFREQCLLIN